MNDSERDRHKNGTKSGEDGENEKDTVDSEKWIMESKVKTKVISKLTMRKVTLTGTQNTEKETSNKMEYLVERTIENDTDIDKRRNKM